MDEKRLTEIEATAQSPAYYDEAEIIGVPELVTEVRRLQARATSDPYEDGRDRAYAEVIAILDESATDAEAMLRIKDLLCWEEHDRIIEHGAG